ncbi:MAG: hypothetical protein SF053_11520, partial [Bacteroidia bacterium]|nr:hypothetical protein [Bacteroidia bacterium]
RAGFCNPVQTCYIGTKVIVMSMTITIELSNMQEAEQVLKLLKSLNIKSVNIQETSSKAEPGISQGDKTLNPRAIFGIWQEHPRTLEQLRSAAWKRNWDI